MSDSYLITKNHNTVLTIYDENNGAEQYNQGFRYIYSIQYGKSYVLKSFTGASWGSGVYELTSEGKIGKCLDWNYDSSG